MHSRSETESDQEGVGAVLMFLERVDVASHTEETSLTFILDAVSPMGFTAGIAEFEGGEEAFCQLHVRRYLVVLHLPLMYACDDYRRSDVEFDLRRVIDAVVCLPEGTRNKE